jgi:hypothetical protein
MLTRARDKTWNFGNPFMLEGVDRELPAGSYRVTTDEELIEGLSFPVYRRVSTMIFVPGRTSGAIEMLTIDPADLEPRRSAMPRLPNLRALDPAGLNDAKASDALLVSRAHGGVATAENPMVSDAMHRRYDAASAMP